jgi:hypothetical protein
MIARLAACALGLACVIAILFVVVFQSRSADFDKDWLYEDLTCEELVEGYNFNLEVLQQIVQQYYQCLDYADSPADAGHGLLHCAFIRKHGEFVQGLTNDLANVFNAKEECTTPHAGTPG